MTARISLAEVQAAAARIRQYAHRTPVWTCNSLDVQVGAQVFFKCENFQKAGAFKFRGACNAVFSLDDDEAASGVATHSSGNHAGALALAARLRGIQAHVVIPRTAPPVKMAAVKAYGGIITTCEPTLKSRESTLKDVVAKTGASFIHPFNDARIIAGQGTAAMELLDEVPELDLVLAPVGGGGLLSGTAVAVSELSPETKVFGAEPANADDAYRSMKAGRIIPSEDPRTIADGLRTSLGSLTFPIIQERVENIVLVSEEAIISAMRYVWERMKIIIEPSAAVAVGAVLNGDLDISGKRVGIILSGGNVDLERLPW
ncbi:MAG: pyridoxal-phosphate dependent enzyme [Fidelibacterota bacterium]|nr:MAG: pyridoxal-phosphate dependent enzyme [Candidatus Neomarinimicrobiota bacterium]